MESIEKIKEEIEQKVKTNDYNELKKLEIYYLGRKGKIASLFNELKQLPFDKKKEFGEKINELRTFAEYKFKLRFDEIEKANKDKELLKEKIDITLPGIKLSNGGLHILSKTIKEVEEIFISMGFDVMTGPEIETDYYNFEALNIPEYHPARDLQDTFYISKNLLLRTQTSPIQVRTMEKQSLPIRIIAVGKCYRRDAADSSHFPIFHQVEGLVVDKNISFANLKATLSEFSKKMFGANSKVRFTPSYFPFVEPGAETSITCVICKGNGCPVCKYSGWLEMGGSGMVHPNVLRNVGINPDEYQGFAFGWGIERIAMVKYGIPDIRMFSQNDIRFLEQFK